MTKKEKAGKTGPTIVKKYANRRLYDTGRSSYVTLDDLCSMVKEGHDFVVQDAKSGEDLTRQVLTQIILDQENKGENMLPESFLKQLIGFYGDSMQAFIPDYLEKSLSLLAENQELFRQNMQKSLESMTGLPATPLSAFEEINRQNRALFEKAMASWSPFTATETESAKNGSK